MNSPVSDSVFMNIDELMEFCESLPDIHTIWNPIIEGSLGLIVGPSKVGKSTFVENLVLNIASQQESYLGYPIDSNNSNIALVLLEENLRHRQKRHRNLFQTFSIEKRELIRNHVQYLGEYHGYIKTKEKRDEIAKEIENTGCNIIVIDSLTRLVNGDIATSESSKAVMKWLRDLNRKLDLTIIVIHHSTKLGEKSFPEMDNIKGATEIVQEVDYAIGLGTINGQTALKTIFSRYSPPDDDYIMLSQNDKRVITRTDKLSQNEVRRINDYRFDDSSIESVKKTVCELLSKSDQEFVRTKDILANSSIQKKSVHRALKKLIGDSYLIRPQRGKYKLK